MPDLAARLETVRAAHRADPADEFLKLQYTAAQRELRAARLHYRTTGTVDPAGPDVTVRPEPVWVKTEEG